MKRFNFGIALLSTVLLIAGVVFSFWLLVLLGIALLIFYGHTTLGIIAALLFDLMLGMPTGIFTFVYFPFLLYTLACVALRALALRMILPRADLGAL